MRRRPQPRPAVVEGLAQHMRRVAGVPGGPEIWAINRIRHASGSEDLAQLAVDVCAALDLLESGALASPTADAPLPRRVPPRKDGAS